MIDIKNLHFRYSRTSPLLFENMSLQLPSGSICGLLGRNGEGKTTMLKLIAGSLLASDGELEVLGKNPQQREPKFLQQVFLLPEIVNTPAIRVGNYLDMMARFYPDYDNDIADEALRTFDINRDMKLGKVSQGQRKKAVITLAMAVRTPLLLMDEPTNSLDIPSKAAFRQLMARYTQDEQTVLISTHQVRDLESLIDRILMLENNRIVCNETIISLGQKFRFAPCNKEQTPPLYTEPSPMGTMGVFPKGEQATGDEFFSIELFFNGMISNPQGFANIMKRS
ncbi:ATP-binding cassette domain-containing protein [Porphyromonas crevioricanis]|uniref:ABC transporter ATP-binding protein n=1 Tax=Porphyromonas crevioricanis TaxID=393921 RepID=A0A2X4PLG2_9PORP|nr:ABC transporter ATP-binding protein [Porphyromonas crevioricanis]KGN96122.1 ABC transporter ATP-binding protein [Porphyromonas crevioricanis]GAD07947.1 ABC transporter, ATP-binding protein [Porphyromonas crevioricanis JCM 13913]SQH72633.1 Uncharacterized ABC transporter ATP-binding protein HI_1470 [Porphyromonas crevioricanis]